MAHLYEIDRIRILPDRQRKSIDDEDLAELARSLRTTGLLHAPVVRKVAEELVLVAGERRLRSATLCHKLGQAFLYEGTPVPSGLIPVSLLGELSAIAAEEAELEENVKRKDLNWQDRAAAESRLHDLRVRQRTEQAGGGELPIRPHTVADTAREVHGRADGYFQDAVKTNLLVAKHLADPDVQKAASAKDALKVLLRKEEVRKNVATAASLGTRTASSLHQLLNVDCLSYMATLPPDQFDVILTDPPYGIDASDFGDSGGKIVSGGEAHRYDDSYGEWQRLSFDFARESFRISKPQAHLYAFCDFDRFHELRSSLQTVGWRVHRTPLIWHKSGNGGRVPWPHYGHRRQWEAICYAVKGERPVNFIGGDVIAFPNDDNLGHGAQKPVALYHELLRRSARPGDRVFDPFAGTGPIFPAAHQIKCLATGIELDAATYAIAARRLAGLDGGDPSP